MEVTTVINGEERELTIEESTKLSRKLKKNIGKLFYNVDVYFEGEEGYKNPKSD